MKTLTSSHLVSGSRVAAGSDTGVRAGAGSGAVMMMPADLCLRGALREKKTDQRHSLMDQSQIRQAEIHTVLKHCAQTISVKRTCLGCSVHISPPRKEGGQLLIHTL